MSDIKTSAEVGYTDSGPAGKQCSGCGNYVSTDDSCGTCQGHNVKPAGSCNYFVAK